MMYVSNTKVLIGRDINQIDMMNELFVVIITIHLVGFTDFA